MIGSASGARDRMVFFLGGKSQGNGKKVQPSGIFRSKKTEMCFGRNPEICSISGFVPSAHHHCLFNAIDPVGDANTAESCEITAIVLKNVKNVGWHAATKLGKPVAQKELKMEVYEF